MNAQEHQGTERMRIGRWIVAVALLGGLLAMLPLTAQQTQTTAALTSSEARAIPVLVTTAQATNGYQIARQFSGVLTAKRQSELSFVRKGLLQDVLYDEGDSVSRGQVVARLDTRELQARRQRFVHRSITTVTTRLTFRSSVRALGSGG